MNQVWSILSMSQTDVRNCHSAASWCKLLVFDIKANATYSSTKLNLYIDYRPYFPESECVNVCLLEIQSESELFGRSPAFHWTKSQPNRRGSRRSIRQPCFNLVTAHGSVSFLACPTKLDVLDRLVRNRARAQPLDSKNWWKKNQASAALRKYAPIPQPPRGHSDH